VHTKHTRSSRAVESASSRILYFYLFQFHLNISGALQATGQRHRLARAVGKRLIPYWVVDIEGLHGDGLVETVVMPNILSLRNVIAGAEVRRYFKMVNVCVCTYD
jgi:hypothetical protein